MGRVQAVLQSAWGGQQPPHMSPARGQLSCAGPGRGPTSWSGGTTGLFCPPHPYQKKSTALSSAPGLGVFKAPTAVLFQATHIHYSVSRINFIIVFSKTILQHVVLYPYAFCKCNTKNDEMIYNSYLFLLLANSMLFLEKHSPTQVNRMDFGVVV